jgi:hypothetical protein
VRFSGYTPNGETLEISANGGPWTPARRQASSAAFDRGHHASYLTAVPAGTTQVRVRTAGTGPGAPDGNNWYVRDIAIFGNVG